MGGAIAEFAQRDILNRSACDRFLLTATLGLRYETTDDQLRIMKIVQGAGTGFAFPSRSLYVGRDSGLDDELKKEAEWKVREWAAAQTLPFPDLPEADRKRITDTLDYPPEGSPGADSE